MDFFSILQNNNQNEKEQKKSKNTNKSKLNKQEKLDIIKEQSKDFINNTNTYTNLKKGDTVKIIRMENSDLNIYKGYLGEIKDYKKGQDFALVYLLATFNLSVVKFPLEHFILINQ